MMPFLSSWMGFLGDGITVNITRGPTAATASFFLLGQPRFVALNSFMK